jgi:hypothetical protein
LRHRRYLLLLAFATAACVPIGPSTITDKNLVGDYSPTINSEAQWQALAARPTIEMTSRTESVKTVYDTSDGKLYLLETKKYPIHYYFAEKYLDRTGLNIPDSETFEREYTSPQRRFILGTVVHYRDPDIWAYELAWCDTLDLKRTVEQFAIIKKAMFVGDKLKYHPVPTAHIAATEALRAQIPVATTDEIFGSARYQALNPGEAFGTLRFFPGAVDPAKVGVHDIVVLAEVPLDLPVVAGVITAEKQAPLSHIAVLSANRRTPNMALKGAMTDPNLTKLDGKLVKLHVTLQDFSVTPAARDDAEKAWAARAPGRKLHLKLDSKDHGLPALKEFKGSDVSIVGAKAAQLGELARFLSPSLLPRAFALPFRAYLSHLQRSGADLELKRMLADPSLGRDPQKREQALANLRKKITDSTVDLELVRAIRKRIAELFPGRRVRFRSSTNAEDLPGFNGAGLYQSVVVAANPTEDQIADALKQVWASVWSFQGVEERTYFGIAPEEVAMAILVQESIDDVSAIGVAITANPYAQALPGVFINAQVGSGSVTSPNSGEVPEQALVHIYPGMAIERMSSSSLTGGKQLLTDGELLALGKVLVDIQHHFNGADWATDSAMDVEFLFAGNDRHVVIVQARPYRMVWDEGRAYVPH